MNILLIHTHIQQHCGISTYVRTMARSLREKGHGVHVVAIDTPMARAFLGDAAPFVGLPLDQYAKTPKSIVQSFAGLVQLIRREEIDIVLASHRWPSLLAYFATRLMGRRLVSVDQNLLWGNKWLTFWGDGVISVSKECRKHLIDYFGVPNEKIELIYNAIAPVPTVTQAERSALFAELGLTPTVNSPILVTVGRLDEQKGQCYLLDALPMIIEQCPQVRLVMVGAGELEADLKAQVELLGVQEQVLFAGMRSDVPAFLAIADLFVLPSLWEGLPFAMLEAMSAGVPVVATDVGGIPEVMALSNPAAGVIVSSHDSAAFGQAVLDLWHNSDMRQSVSTSAREVVQEHFSDTEMVDRTEAYLQNFL